MRSFHNFACLVAAVVFVVPSALAQDKKEGFGIEVTPYAWLAGVDGDVTVGDRTVEVDAGFDDLIDAVDLAASFLLVGRYNRIVIWEQFDYMALDSSNIEDSPDVASVESDTIFSTTAVGYQFDGFLNSKIDVMAGLRYGKLENQLNLPNNSFDKTTELYDGVLVFRPDFELLSWLHFNPTWSIGAGDSDFTYELQPQFQMALTDSMAARVGYRRLYYDTDKFEGSFHGLIAGLGFTF